MDKGYDRFALNELGALVHTASLNGLLKVLVPVFMPQTHPLESRRKSSRASGREELHETMRHAYYWPTMAVSNYHTVLKCPSCAKNLVYLSTHTNSFREMTAFRFFHRHFRTTTKNQEPKSHPPGYRRSLREVVPSGPIKSH